MLLSDWSKSVHGVLGSQNHSVETSAAKMDFFGLLILLKDEQNSCNELIA